MQGGRSILDSLPDTIDLNQGSVSGSNSNAMDHSSVWGDLLNPAENRLSNYMLSSGETSAGCETTSSHIARRFSDWDTGESSTGARAPDHMHDDLKIGQSWSSSISSCAISDAMEEDQPEQSDVVRSENGSTNGGNYVNRSSLNMSISGSDHCSQNVYLDSGWQGTSSRSYLPGRAETHGGLTFGSSTKNPGVSSSNFLYRMENSDESGSSLGASGSSSKRKAVEGCTAQFYPGGSSSAHAEAEKVMWHDSPGRQNTTANFTVSPPMCWPDSQPEQMNPRIGIGVRGTSSELFPHSSESSARNVGGRLNVGHQEQDMFSFPLTDAALGSSRNQTSRSLASSESSMLINSPYHPSQSHGYSGIPYPWNGSIDSQSGSSLHPFMLSHERAGTTFRDEHTSRNNLRDSQDLPAAFTSFERSHLVRDSPSSSLALGNSHSPRSLIPTSRSGSSSSMHNRPTGWVADQNLTGHNQQGLIEYAPWTPFPPVELDYGNQRGHFHVTPPESLSSVEADMLSYSNRRRQHRNSMSALMMDSPSDAISSWRALAVDVEGRQRLIRQVRNAVRRRDNWRAQDFAIFGQFVNGAAELRDRHSDMRLDVDSMSYEDLLALEERIGNVSTGLNEETIMKSMKQRKYHPTQSSSNDEACCICREDYVTGDDIGTVACSHEFHTDCIKQWLFLKNLCPICKTAALET